MIRKLPTLSLPPDCGDIEWDFKEQGRAKINLMTAHESYRDYCQRIGNIPMSEERWQMQRGISTSPSGSRPSEIHIKNVDERRPLAMSGRVAAASAVKKDARYVRRERRRQAERDQREYALRTNA